MRQQRKIAPIGKEDRAYFDEFLVKYEKFIIFLAKKYQSPVIALDDIVQEAELRLLEKIATLRNSSHNRICSYIHQAVQWAFLDLYRKEIRHSHVSMDSILEDTVGKECDYVPDLFVRQELQRLRTHLSAREWMALKSKYIYGYSQDELGRQLDMKPDSVRTFLHRLRIQCRQILTPEKVTGGDDDD